MSVDEFSVPPATIALVRRVAGGLPVLEALLAEHVEDNDEILPSLFLGQVGSWYTANYDSREARELVSRLDGELAGAAQPASVDVEVQSAICFGFLEMLAPGQDGAPAGPVDAFPTVFAWPGGMSGTGEHPRPPSDLPCAVNPEVWSTALP